MTTKIITIDKKNIALETLSTEIAQARNDVKKGRVHSQESIMKEFFSNQK